MFKQKKQLEFWRDENKEKWKWFENKNELSMPPLLGPSITAV